ncbi:RagB/SusD family nutrient uptake outer membrane protein [Pedobacter sp. PLR]|uniref:RagB/SusD family nutrient uptake outer membrane protein n=1 Tax=Pedobacter sp. PLR TaxID=2994465 RepID=UPI002246B566|nr:RagB/SusD family nutrient uptake outer membrane protein [Pedobacter sp. PLR]MCX2453038.1 RagB/SusD family nutrient uptake outer membrane protein [Pedobacter sp. PLR]
MIKKYKLAVAVLLTLTATSCKDDLDLKPYNALTTEQIVNTVEGLTAATIGTYNYIKDPYYMRNYHMLSEYASDNVSLSGTTTDGLFYAYNYQHLKNQGNTEQIWRKGYQAIYGTNVVIEKVTQSDNAAMNQLLGENYFLRGMIHFDLVRFFGRPYTDNNGESLGIVIKTNSNVKELGSRAKVKDVYALVVADLLKSIELMGSTKSNIFASKEVAMALLSRVYLYMGDYDNAFKYADEVIKSNRYALVSSSNLGSYFTVAPGGDQKSQETIFAIKHDLKDDRGADAIGSMYFTAGGDNSYGEMYASQSYRNLLDKFPNDLRHAFIRPNYEKDGAGNVKLDANGNPILAKRNGYPIYYVMKYSYQDGVETLSSPVVVRLAEMYLTRAEAAVKLGRPADALSDVNIIRERAGLKGLELFSAGNMMGYTDVLDVVLDERRLELAFEAQRKFDVFRNKRTMVRNYPGTHLPSGQVTQEIPYTSPRVIYYIPQSELTVNPNLVQNPE